MDESNAISDDFVEHDVAAASKDVVREVATWKLEAKAEDNDRYFFHVRDVSSIENGEKCYVIGRKGSGKTAICEYLGRENQHNTSSEKLTFKNCNCPAPPGVIGSRQQATRDRCSYWGGAESI